MNVKTLTTDELLQNIGKRGVAQEIERRRQSREGLNRQIRANEVITVRGRLAHG